MSLPERLPRLLILNPNTGQATSQRLLALAQPLVGHKLSLRQATARMGARYISDEVSALIAGHAALDAYALDVAAHGPPDAVLLACFGDPGLFALRAMAGVPVFGLAQAAMQEAALLGPFVVVTGGAAWVPMLRRLARALDVADSLLGVHTLEATGGQIAGQGLAAVPALRSACAQALQRWPQASCVLLGGAGLAGLAEAVGPIDGVPVLDNWPLALQAVQHALAAPVIEPGPHQVDSERAASQQARSAGASTPGPEPAPAPAAQDLVQPAAADGWLGLSPELQAMLRASSQGPAG